MKKRNLIIGIVGVILFSSILVFAQKTSIDHHNPSIKESMFMMKNLSAEQIATLQTKRLVFYLDLNDSQSKKIKTIYLEVAKLRKEKMQELINKGEKPDAEIRYQMAVIRLNKLIEVKAQLKTILTETQLDNWVKIQIERNMLSERPNFSEIK